MLSACTCASCMEVTEKLELMSCLFWSKAAQICTAVNPHLSLAGSIGTVIEMDWRLV